MRFDNIKLIYPPVVSLSQFKCAGSKVRSSLRRTSGSVIHIVKIVSEIHGVQFRTETFRPAKFCSKVYQLGTISRVGVICGLGGNRKAPDLTFPGTIGFGFIYFINSPVVSCSRHKTIRIRKSGKTDNKIRLGLVASECLGGAVVHQVKIVTEVHIVRESKFARLPGKVHPRVQNQRAIFRIGTTRERLVGDDSRKATVHYRFNIFSLQSYIE